MHCTHPPAGAGPNLSMHVRGKEVRLPGMPLVFQTGIFSMPLYKFTIHTHHSVKVYSRQCSKSGKVDSQQRSMTTAGACEAGDDAMINKIYIVYYTIICWVLKWMIYFGKLKENIGKHWNRLFEFAKQLNSLIDREVICCGTFDKWSADVINCIKYIHSR